MKKRKNLKLNKKRLIGFSLIITIIVIVIVIYNSFVARTVVCIDAGHGGDDVGSINEEVDRYEKDDNLKIAKAVKSELQKQGIKVVMTRNSDKTVSLEDRCEYANKKNADLFVSIHRNSAEIGNGVEIWTKSSDNEDDLELANNIMDMISQTDIQSNRGVKEGTSSGESSDYYVNKYTNMPSCLIELGFISNDEDNKLLDENIDEYAKAIADGIVETLNNEN